MSLSLVVCARNEAERLPRLLASVNGIVSEVVLGDNASEDGTQALVAGWCDANGVRFQCVEEDRVLGHPEPFKQAVIDAATGDWLLLLDADEELAAEGRTWLVMQACIGDRTVTDAYAIPRSTIILGRWDGSAPDEVLCVYEYPPRLFRRGCCVQPPTVHTLPHTTGGRVERVESERPFIMHARTGWEQLRRDKLRGQYPEVELPQEPRRSMAGWITSPPPGPLGEWSIWEPDYLLSVREVCQGAAEDIIEWHEDLRPFSSWQLVAGRLHGKRVLEIGAGMGWISVQAAREGAEVLATDIDGGNLPTFLPHLIVDKESDLPCENGALYDFVLCANVLHHGHLLTTLRRAREALLPDGELISFQEPCRPNDAPEAAYLREHCAAEIAAGLNERRPSLREYLDALETAGFRDVEVWEMNEQLFANRRGRALVALTASDYHGGIALRAVK